MANLDYLRVGLVVTFASMKLCKSVMKHNNQVDVPLIWGSMVSIPNIPRSPMYGLFTSTMATFVGRCKSIEYMEIL